MAVDSVANRVSSRPLVDGPGRFRQFDLKGIIAEGPEGRQLLTVPIGCPLPAGELAAYVADADQDLACRDCHFFRQVELGPGGSLPRSGSERFRFGFCCAPERQPVALVDVIQLEREDEDGRFSADRNPNATARLASDTQVLACLDAGVRHLTQIKTMTGLGTRTIWKALGRLRRAGLVGADVQITRRRQAA